MKIGFNVPQWRNKAFNEFTNEELLEYWYKLRLGRTALGDTEITVHSTSSDLYIVELQQELLTRLNPEIHISDSREAMRLTLKHILTCLGTDEGKYFSTELIAEAAEFLHEDTEFISDLMQLVKKHAGSFGI